MTSNIIRTIARSTGLDTQTVSLVVIGVGLLIFVLVIALLVVLIVKGIRSGSRKKSNSIDTPTSGKAQIKQMKKAAKAEIKRTKAEAKQKKTGQTPTLESNDPSASDDGETGSEQLTTDVQSDIHLQTVVDELADKKGKNKKESNRNKEKTKKLFNKTAKNTRGTSRQLKNKAQKLKIPKSAQETIPYQKVYADDGVIEIEPGVFTKSYLLEDVNYQVAKDDEQAEMFLKYGEFLNSFDPTMRVQITFNQKNINQQEFEDSNMMPMRGDKLDELRVESNESLKKKLLEGKNNLIKEKYITVSVQAIDYESARTIFSRLDTDLPSNIKKIGGASAVALSATERLEILHDIYNQGNEGMFGNNMVLDKNGNLVFAQEKFSFDIMRRMGLTTKDMIAPDSFSFKSDYGMVGDKYFRALFLRKLPSFLGDNVLAELTNTNLNMITSIIFEPIESEKALKMVRNQITNINANVVKKQKMASKSGYDPSLISPELNDASDEAKELFHDLAGKNQKLFYMTMVIVHFADTKEDLDSDTKSIQTIGRRLVVDVRKLSWQQENGLASVVPLCNNKLQIKRSLTTESASVFMPFVNQELNDHNGGMCYGINAVSRNLIMLNRRNAQNGNGFILGKPGSGKSMGAKWEMMEVLLSSDDIVVVIDPENEYKPMAELLGGEVVRIAAGSNVHINPFDIDMHLDSNDNPITIKCDFIVSLCETIIGDRFGLTPSQRSLIDRAVKEIYIPFLESRDNETGEYDYSLVPTMHEFYNYLRAQSGYEAMQLADGLAIYVTGSLDVFAHRTNVEHSSRFVVYDINGIGTTMKSMGLLVVLDSIWNRIVAGRKEGINVWFYIDEIYLLFKIESSAVFLQQLYKRARKYGGMPTGITQNVEDLLKSDIARTMISNCDFIMMYNQAPLDRAQLAQLLNISNTQLSYITNSNFGEGLIYDGSHIVPFINRIPSNTKMYAAMTTKLKEVKDRDNKTEETEPVLVADDVDISSDTAS